MSNHFEVIVVGAGPGGSAVAALLAHAGKQVLLVDKNVSAGGRMMTIHDKEGFHYELFPINGCPFENAQMDNVLEAIGKKDAVKRINPKELGLADIMYIMDKEGELRANEMSGVGEDLFNSLRISLSDTEGIGKIQELFSAIMTMSEEDLRALDNTSTEEFVDSFGTFPGLFRTYFLFQCEGPFEMSCDKVPASDFIRFIHKTTAHGAGRYYEFGLGRVFEVYAEAVEELGGTVLFKTRVDSINIKDGVATGITLQNGDIYTADVIISDAGIRQTVNKLVGEDKFDASYIERINSLVPNLACIGYRWFLDAPVLKSPMIIVFPEGGLYTWDEFKAMAAGEISDIRNYVYFGTTSLYPNTAPEGKQLVYAVMSCYPDPELDPQPMLDYIKSIVQKVQPDLFDHIYKSERMTLQQVHYVGTENLMSHLGGESYGVANAIGQSGTQRPSAKSPIRNLYYVGNDAGGWGMGTDQAVDSAVNVAKMVLDS